MLIENAVNYCFETSHSCNSRRMYGCIQVHFVQIFQEYNLDETLNDLRERLMSRRKFL